MPARDLPGYRRDIDGLRALAVLVVIGFHAVPTAVPGGYVGVDVFFVISGYLITGIVERSLASAAFSFDGFYARRIRRIFPALILVLAASLVAGWFLLLPVRYASLGKHVVGSAGFAANFVTWSEAGYFDARAIEKPLLHLWSLGIEEQFYVVWPLVLWLLYKLRRAPLWPLLAIVVLSCAAGIALTAYAPDAAFYLPLSRMWELAIGGVLAVSTRARVRGAVACAIAGLALLAVSVAMFDATTPYPGWCALLPTAGTCLIIVAGPTSPINRWLLGNRIVVAIGLVSYPLYLWHWVLLSFGFLYGAAEPAVAVRLALVVASLALAGLTYALVERPLRTRRASTTQAVTLATALVLVAAAGRIIERLDGVPQRFSTVAAALLERTYDYLSDAHAGECWLDTHAAADGFAATCMPAHTAIFVWGDSHAARLRPGIERATQAVIGSHTRDVCPPSLATTGDCLASNRATLAALARAKPETVVLFASWSAYPSEVIDELPRLAQTLVDAGVRHVVIAGPAPRWTTNLPELVYEAWSEQALHSPVPARLTSHLLDSVAAADRALAAVTWPAHARYVSVLSLLCTTLGCLTFVPGSTELTAYDYGHLTTAGAELVARGLRLEQVSEAR